MMINKNDNDRKKTNNILRTMHQFDYKPEVVNSFLYDVRKTIKILPLSHQLEIELAYNQLFGEYND